MDININQLNLASSYNRLSSFGRKVLEVLVDQWKYEKDYNNRRDGQKKCFQEQDRCSRYSSKNSAPRSQQITNSKKCNLIFSQKVPPNVPRPSDLSNLNEVHEKTDQDIVVSDDLVTTGFNSKTKLLNSITLCNNENNKENSSDTYHFGIDCIPEVRHSFDQSNDKGNVSWSNMFDAELFEDDTKIDENRFLSCAHSPEIPLEIFKKPAAKSAKRKAPTLKTDLGSKRDKTTIPIQKNTYRKENYTSTVKNWLDDVDQHADNHSNEVLNSKEESAKSKNEFTMKKASKKLPQTIVKTEPNSIENGNAPTATSPNVDSHREKPKKKVVQSQLANKGGKMKFGKPKIQADDPTKTERPERPEKVPIEKKPKSKFVAPIKSQIPVKDVTFKIASIEENNARDYENLILQFENLEVSAVLVYRNGFCQLNGCYTEDSCIPEGLLISFTNDEGFYYFTNINEKLSTIVWQLLERNTMICYEGKNILIYLSHLDMTFTPKSIIDVKIGGALLDPENPPETFGDLQELIGFVPEFTIATDSTLQKVAWYTTLLKECSSKLKTLLVENSLWNVFVDIEMQLLPIIADMERQGVAVDLDKLNWMEQLLIVRLEAVEQECYKAAGKSFQINSTPQLRALLYDDLNLDSKCNIKIRETLVKGDKSTSEDTLRSLMSVHPLPRLVLQYRHLHKAHSTFLTGIAQHVKDGVVRPTWVQTAAATGRIASNNPNLQAIPKAPFSLTLFPESDDVDEPKLNFRSVYVSGAGCSLLAADFKHVECRVLAHAAGDAALQAALRSDDLFRVLAAEWLKKSPSDVSTEERERTKRVVYGSVYGCGARRLAAVLGVPYDRALQVRASFNRTFPSLKSFGRSVVERCQRDGGRLSTLCGRVRTFKSIFSDDFAARSHAERQAVNFIVQGSAADLCKAAMAAAGARLRGRARLLLQIHDELLWEVPDDHLMDVAGAVKELMEGCGAARGLRRLPVALAAGRSWADMQPLALP